MKLITLLLVVISWQHGLANPIGKTYLLNDTPLVVRRCADFGITGKGENMQWDKTSWVTLKQIDKTGKDIETRFKILYSATGLYVLFSGQDEKITSPYNNDYDLLYNGDVFEVFFHPDPASPLYFEYEVSPLNKELVLLISQKNKKFTRWRPFGQPEQKIIKNVNIRGGQMSSGSKIEGWSAEMFFPYELLGPMITAGPVSGMRWNANFCRLDYDSGKMIKWSWSPIKVSFHEFQSYLPIRFE
jgi:hypothetical protein